jgi:hypothetical protein
MIVISKEFPEVLFDLYHVSYDYSLMEVYSFRNGELINESKAEVPECKLHTGTIRTLFSFDSVEPPGNISIYFNEDYPYCYEAYESDSSGEDD